MRLAIRRGLAWTALALCCAAQPQKLSLAEAGARTGSDFTPAFERRSITTSGTVAARAVWMIDAFLLPIQDKESRGLFLQGTLEQFEALEPGDQVEAAGVIARRSGLPVLQTELVKRLSTAEPPLPKTVSLAALSTFRYLGVLVNTEARVSDVRETSAGNVVDLTDGTRLLSVFLPSTRHGEKPGLTDLRRGDRVRVSGLSSQYCPVPPFDRSFQILLTSPAGIAVMDRAWLVPSALVLGLFLFSALVLGVWWMRERRMGVQLRVHRSLNALGEEIIAARSPEEIYRRLQAVLPAIWNASNIRMYVYNRADKMLELIQHAGAAPVYVPIDAATGVSTGGAALCFRNRTLLHIPDTRRNPFFRVEEKEQTPRSVLFVPMLAQADLMGVLGIEHEAGVRPFSPREQETGQHLANQIATALKLQEQHSIREQLFRTEKMAAAGQVVASVANELLAPLHGIFRLASEWKRTVPGAERSAVVQSLIAETQRASEIVTRLVGFGDKADVEMVNLSSLIREVLDGRGNDWRGRGISVRLQMAPGPVWVMGSGSQLEQVLANVFSCLWQIASTSSSEAGTLAVTCGQLAGRALAGLVLNMVPAEREDGKAEPPASEAGIPGLEVCRAILNNHGGTLALSRTSASEIRIDLELPVADEDRAGEELRGARSARRFTALVIEPDQRVQSALVELLSARSHRVVPVSGPEEALEMVQRLRFDLLFCSMRLSSSNWVECFERMRHHTGAFILLTEGYDPDLARAFHGKEAWVLSKPVQGAELDRVLDGVEQKLEPASAERSS